MSFPPIHAYLLPQSLLYSKYQTATISTQQLVCFKQFSTNCPSCVVYLHTVLNLLLVYLLCSFRFQSIKFLNQFALLTRVGVYLLISTSRRGLNLHPETTYRSSGRGRSFRVLKEITSWLCACLIYMFCGRNKSVRMLALAS